MKTRPYLNEPYLTTKEVLAEGFKEIGNNLLGNHFENEDGIKLMPKYLTPYFPVFYYEYAPKRHIKIWHLAHLKELLMALTPYED